MDTIRKHTGLRIVKIGNSSGITRTVYIASNSNKWEWTLPPNHYRTFDFRDNIFGSTLFNLKDYASGTQFDVYGGHAPIKRNNNIELWDDHIEVNRQSYSHDHLKKTEIYKIDNNAKTLAGRSVTFFFIYEYCYILTLTQLFLVQCAQMRQLFIFFIFIFLV